MTQPQQMIYLASASPRRRELLAQIGVRFELLAFRSGARADPAVDETPNIGESPENYSLRVAEAKARHALALIEKRRLTPRIVLAADTTLDVDGEIIGKPRDDAEASAILQRLSARWHRVMTAVVVARQNQVKSRLSVSQVHFANIAPAQLHRYIASGEPRDKAGAYGIQGRAAIFVKEIKGSHSAIVGLPLYETAQLLSTFGLML